MRRKRLTLAVGVCFVAVIIVVVVVRLGPPPKRVLDSALVTYDCTDVAATSLRAHADIIDDGGDWVTRRGFQYAVSNEKDLPDIIPLLNASFEYGEPPTAWLSSETSGRTTEHMKVGTYSLKVTSRESNGQHWTYQILNDMSHLEGEDVTFGVWLWSDAPDRLLLVLRAYAGWQQLGATFSSMHPGDGQWHWLSVTRQMDAGLDRIRVDVHMAEGDVISGYADGALLVQGTGIMSVFEDGEFSTGTYALDITVLEPETVYVIRAFAENRAGVSYGNTGTCHTSAP